MTLEKAQLELKPINEDSQVRLYFLDWLRIFATILLFFFHTARVFSFESNYVENDIISPTIVIFFIGVINTFHMPLFFFISGASSYLSLKKRGIKKYAIERVLRLLVPFIFGLLLVVPPQPFLAAKIFSGYTGNFLNWLFFDYWQTGLGDIEGYRGTLTPAHLWFIGVLFILSFVALPVIILMERKDGKFLEKISNYGQKRPFLFIYIIPAIIIIGFLVIPAEIAGKNPLYYLACFLLGYIIIRNNILSEKILSFRKYLYIIIGIGYPLIIVFRYLSIYTGFYNPTMSFIIYGFDRAIVMWATILILYSVFREKANQTGKIHRYAYQAAYPVYIQHQTWLFFVAYFVVQLPIHYGFKYIIILIGGFVISIIGYEIIKRVNFLRIIFGMKWIPQLHRKKKIVNNRN